MARRTKCHRTTNSWYKEVILWRSDRTADKNKLNANNFLQRNHLQLLFRKIIEGKLSQFTIAHVAQDYDLFEIMQIVMLFASTE